MHPLSNPTGYTTSSSYPNTPNLSLNTKTISLLLVIMLFSNFLTYTIFNIGPIGNRQSAHQEHAYAEAAAHNRANKNLYLIDHAEKYVYNVEHFEKKVRQVSKGLDIPPEWLMAVMYSESKFDASVSNSKGSGATGLIQWMPTTAKDFDITVEKLRNLNHVEQLDYVFKYLDRIQRSRGEFKSITDLYLGILYPKAVGETPCYTLYAKPSKTYEMNRILDENKDGMVTVQDITERMKRMFPTAYMAQKESRGNGWMWLGL